MLPFLSFRPARRLVAGAALLALASTAGAMTLPEALDAAARNLDVQIAARGLAAARADILAADRAPLPQLSAKLSQMDLQNGIGGGNPLTQRRIDKGVGLDWTWERGDKRGLRTEAARRAAGAAEADLDDTRLQAQLFTQAAFFDLLAAQQRLVELAEIERAATQTADAATARLKAGDVATQDADRAAIEADRARADRSAALLDQQRARQALAVLTGAATNLADLARLNADGAFPTADAAPQAALNASLTAAVEQRADVRAAAERVKAAEANLAGSQALRRSDITWGASVDHYPGTSTRLLELRLSMPLAFGDRYEGEIGRSQAQLDQARDALEKTRQAALADVARLQDELATARDRLGRYSTGIVPRAQAVAERAELAYTKGAMPLTDLLDARRTLRAVRLEALAAQADHAKALTAWQLRATASPATPPLTPAR